jgi:aspartyl-tRNA(Asn)/glutamyl-tRNA(Gln) amidotransferase subunit A
MLATDYMRALRIRRKLLLEFNQLFEHFDVLLTPGTPSPAPRLSPQPDPVFFDGERMWMQDVSRHFIGLNLIGVPAIVLPAGLAADPTRPVSIQLAAAPGGDDLVLSVASALQLAIGR